MQEETNHVKDLADLTRQAVRVSKQPGLGLYLLDQELRRMKASIPWGTTNDIHEQNDLIARITDC